jgi:hypothetical protein
MTDNRLRECLRNLVDAAEAALNDEPRAEAALRMAAIAAQLELEGGPREEINLDGPPDFIEGEAAVRQWFGERDRLNRKRMEEGA